MVQKNTYVGESKDANMANVGDAGEGSMGVSYAVLETSLEVWNFSK